MGDKNKVALITGASRGIGRAIAISLAKDGYNLVLNYKNSKEQAEQLGKELKKKYKIKAIPFQADLESTEECEKLALFAINTFKRVDVLINNAGVCLDEELKDRTVGQFEKSFRINLYAPFILTKIIGELMVEQKFGKIINISSNNSINQFNPSTIDYDATKCALNSLTKNFAIAFSPYVNVNAIAPGWIETEMNKDLSGDYMESEKKNILKKRIGKPEDVANLVSFLVSDKADYINGEVIVIDGGMF